jgi:hypothetical protein
VHREASRSSKIEGGVHATRSNSSVGGHAGSSASPRKGLGKAGEGKSQRPVVLAKGGAGVPGLESLSAIEGVLSKQQMSELRALLDGVVSHSSSGGGHEEYLQEHKERLRVRKSSIRRASIKNTASTKVDGTGVNVWSSTKNLVLPAEDEETEYIPNAFENLKTIKDKPSGKRFWVDNTTPKVNHVSTASAFKFYGKLRSKQVQASTKIFDEKEYIKGLLHMERYQGKSMANAEVWLAGVDTLLDKRAHLREFERRLQEAEADLKDALHDVLEIEGSIKVSIAGAEPEEVLAKLRSDLEAAKLVVEKKRKRREVASTAVEMNMVSVKEVESLMPSRKNQVERKIWDAMVQDLLVPQPSQELKDHQTQVIQNAIDEMRRCRNSLSHVEACFATHSPSLRPSLHPSLPPSFPPSLPPSFPPSLPASLSVCLSVCLSAFTH